MSMKNTNIKQPVKAKKSQPKKATVQKAATPLIVEGHKVTEKVQSFQEQVRELRQCFTQEQDCSEGRQAVQQVVSPAPRLQTAKDIEEYQKKTSNVISKHNVAYGEDGLWYKVKFTSKKPMCIGEWETYLLNVHFNSPIKFHSVLWSSRQKKSSSTKYAIALYHTGFNEQLVVSKLSKNIYDFDLGDRSSDVTKYISPVKLERITLYRNKKYLSEFIYNSSIAPSFVDVAIKKIKAVGEDRPSWLSTRWKQSTWMLRRIKIKTQQWWQRQKDKKSVKQGKLLPSVLDDKSQYLYDLELKNSGFSQERINL